MLWIATTKKRVRLKGAVISQALLLSVKLPLVSPFGPWTLIHLQFLFTKKFYWFRFSSSLDDWFTAGSSTTCVYPSSRYGFLVLTSNLESLCHSEWLFWFIFTWKENFSVVIFKTFLTSVECESGLKLPFLCGELCLFRDFFP